MRSISGVMVIISAVLLSACGTSAASYNNEGNDAFETEQYGEALNSYTLAKQEDPALAEPYYNAGNALHRQGEMDSAALQLQESLRGSEGDLAQKSFYNLGNTYFKEEDWMSAIDAYRQALLINPEDAEAKYNLELALQNLLNEQPPPPQQQQQDQNQQQPNQGGQQPDQQEQPQQNQDQGQGEEPQENEGDGDGEEEEDESGSGDQQEQDGQGGQGELSPEEAKQLLDALGQDSQTLQERLQQQFGGSSLPPEQDW